MSEQKAVWERVTKHEPCEVCGHDSWCCRGEKGWNCMRIDSPKALKNGGWFHPFDSNLPKPASPVSKKKVVPEQQIDCGEIMAHWRKHTIEDRFREMAQSLRVSEQSLKWLGAAWSSDRHAVAFPMFDGNSPSIDGPIGIRLRADNGSKFAVTGSRAGIFIPYGAMITVRHDRVFICEGPTDTAACLDMGLFALGRASCRGQEEMMLWALEQIDPKEVVVVSDNDGPGIEGAEAIFGHIMHKKVMLTPPGKDILQFARDGGNAALLESILKNLVWQ